MRDKDKYIGDTLGCHDESSFSRAFNSAATLANLENTEFGDTGYGRSRLITNLTKFKIFRPFQRSFQGCFPEILAATQMCRS